MKKNAREEAQKTKPRRLLLSRETIRALDEAALKLVRGEEAMTRTSDSLEPS